MSARIPPGGLRQVGAARWAFARIAGRAMGTHPPAVFTTLGRTKGLFTGWLHFAGRLMPFGTLPRRESELVILAVAAQRGCRYEMEHHRRLGRRAGLTNAEVEALCQREEPQGLDRRARIVRDSAIALVRERDLDDEQWERLRGVLSDREALELLLLVGHYDMLATTLMTLRIEPDPPR